MFKYSIITFTNIIKFFKYNIFKSQIKKLITKILNL